MRREVVGFLVIFAEKQHKRERAKQNKTKQNKTKQNTLLKKQHTNHGHEENKCRFMHVVCIGCMYIHLSIMRSPYLIICNETTEQPTYI
jgi:hypothetical protein